MIDTIYSDPDFLAHHGVKGMKWGVRKDDHTSIKDRNGAHETSGYYKYEQARKNMRKWKRESAENDRQYNKEISRFKKNNSQRLDEAEYYGKKLTKKYGKEFTDKYLADRKDSYMRAKQHGKLAFNEVYDSDIVKNYINERGETVTYDDISKANAYETVHLGKLYVASYGTYNQRLIYNEFEQEKNKYIHSRPEVKDYQNKYKDLADAQNEIYKKHYKY